MGKRKDAVRLIGEVVEELKTTQDDAIRIPFTTRRAMEAVRPHVAARVGEIFDVSDRREGKFWVLNLTRREA